MNPAYKITIFISLPTQTPSFIDTAFLMQGIILSLEIDRGHRDLVLQLVFILQKSKDTVTQSQVPSDLQQQSLGQQSSQSAGRSSWRLGTKCSLLRKSGQGTNFQSRSGESRVWPFLRNAVTSSSSWRLFYNKNYTCSTEVPFLTKNPQPKIKLN